MMKYESGGLDHRTRVWAGLDQSYTGFAVTLLARNDDYYTCVKAFDGTGTERLSAIQYWLECVLQDHNVAEIAMEGPVHVSSYAHMGGELAAAVKLFLHDYYANSDLPRRPYIVPPTQVKKYATGRGNAKKSEVMLAVYKRWGVELTDDNAADSYVLARIARGDAVNRKDEEIIASRTR